MASTFLAIIFPFHLHGGRIGPKRDPQPQRPPGMAFLTRYI
jgi:hypothetical protein